MTQPPRPEKRPSERKHHGHTFVDDYEWLRDKDSPEVLAHLEAENAYAEARQSHLAGLRDDIFADIKAHTLETDLSVPNRRGDYWYYGRTFEGKQYGTSCRAPVAGPEDWTPPSLEPGVAIPGEEVLLDLNALAEGHEFFSVGSTTMTDDATLLAYSVDVVGDERYTIYVKDLRSGELLSDLIPKTAPGQVWDASGRYLFYSTVDDAWRPDTIWRHELGTPAAQDAKVFHEPDERFWVGIGSTRSEDYLMIATGSPETSAFLSLRADDPLGEFATVWEREEGLLYSVEHARIDGEDRFLVTHNRDRADSDIVDVPADAPRDESRFRPVIADVEGKRIEEIDAFASVVAVSYREDGLARLGVARIVGGESPYAPLEEVTLDEPIGTMGLGANPEWDAPTLRFGYASLVTPTVVADLNLATGERRILKQQPVLGGYDPADYAQARLWATAEDGTRIPLSAVYRKDAVELRPDGSGPVSPAPLLLSGYGSYELSRDPGMSISRLPMLDRGVVFVIAHVRGGGEMGRAWYDEGKKLKKRNTFTDFIASADHLIESGWSSPERMVAMGGSAGGLLMGAVANMAPDRFAAICTQVPFVDALTSILMPELPLTVVEWEEWGDPLHDAGVYEYMRTYSPYENVTEQRYPQILATTSLNDTRVLYVEPAKWVARLRDVGADALMKIEMQAGHGGVSGRYNAWKELAFELAFVLDSLGLADVPSVVADRRDEGR